MAVCNIPGCDEHYGCRLRSKGIAVSPRVTATRTQNWRPTPSVPPAYNRTLQYDVRADGSQMPILNSHGDHMRQREFDEKRHHVTNTLRHNRNLTTNGA